MTQLTKPATERVQVFADISRSALCCHNNEIRAPIANPPNSAQLENTPYHSPSYIRVRAVLWECGEGQADRHADTQTAVANIHFASAMPDAKFNKNVTSSLSQCKLQLLRDTYKRTVN